MPSPRTRALERTAGVCRVCVGGEFQQETSADLGGVAAADPVCPQFGRAQRGGEGGGGLFESGGKGASVSDTVVEGRMRRSRWS